MKHKTKTPASRQADNHEMSKHTIWLSWLTRMDLCFLVVMLLLSKFVSLPVVVVVLSACLFTLLFVVSLVSSLGVCVAMARESLAPTNDVAYEQLEERYNKAREKRGLSVGTDTKWEL